MKPFHCFVALLISLSLFGCKPKETTLSGQVFVVTRGAENIKLGLVEVQLIEKQEAVEFLKKRQQEVDEQMNVVSNDFSKLCASGQTAVEADTKRLSESSSEEEKVEITKSLIKFKSVLEDTMKVLAHLPSDAMYFTNFSPVIIQKALTDADGRFSLSYPRDKKFTLFAKAERVVGDTTETYFWLVNAPTGIETAQIFLSNNNAVTVDPDGYFKIKPKSEFQESAP